ncbi:MAG: DUF4982 domain-containing protein [Lachnoclostridium sp.]|nr:DUF4982 domain-containing protein [Lachnoclostridium sp.]
MKQLFNDNWVFLKKPFGTELNDFIKSNEWIPVDIPHDWMIYDVNNLYANTTGCYKKIFTVPDMNQCIFLRFEGVHMDTTIFLNGEEIFTWKYGFSTFDVDLTGRLKQGPNEIIVRAIYQLPNCRWYPGSGIYRNVWLITKPNTYFVPDGSYISMERIGNDWNVYADLEICTKSKREISISHTISDLSGNYIAQSRQELTVHPGITTDKQVIFVSHPELWDIEHPALYQIISKLSIDDESIDTIEQCIGFRTIRFDADKGFFLNDRNVKINGVCQHHDLGSLGAATNKTALRRQFAILKEMGVNSVRSAHNMPSVEFMDLADEMGLLVYSESFDMWELTKTDYDYGNYFNEWWERDLTSWVRRDRNHPSLFIWGIGNEIHDTYFERGLELTQMLHKAVVALDPRKNGYTSLASNQIASENAQLCSDVVDLSGYNYSEYLYDEHHEKYPHWYIFGSETSSTVQSRGIYHFPADNHLLTYEDLQCSSLFNCTTNWGAKSSYEAIRNHRDRNYCFGQYLWSGWDYIGEPTPYFTKNSYFGQIDTAGFKKDSFYAYQAEWTDYKKTPMIHLLPYWDFNDGQIIDVIVSTNAPIAELFLNGRSQGRIELNHTSGADLFGKWQIPYEEGVLQAFAYDEEYQVIASDEQKSFGDPVSIQLLSDKTVMSGNGEDLIFVEIRTLDKEGVFVANSRSRMNVSVTGAGRLIGLDNGDSTDYDAYKGTSRKLFSGKLLAIIAAKQESGDIQLKVSSPSLESAEMIFHAEEAPAKPGTSSFMENIPSPISDEIPIRKIELTNSGIYHFNKEQTETTVTAKIYPHNATRTDLTFKAITKDGIESNSVFVDQKGMTAFLTALGDGEFRLCACANNGSDHPEVLSELEFDITGMGKATLNPFGFVSAISYSESNFPLTLSFQGGVYITSDERTYLSFENVDFGDYGSDEIHLPIFSFSNTVPIEVWDGMPDKGGKILLKDTYTAKSWYNHYQDNVFPLKERLKGIHTLSIVVIPDVKMSLKGFRFTYTEKAFAKIFASEHRRITGDAFTVGEEYVTDIGNNVSIEFENMNFGEQGCTKLMICGRSVLNTNTIHLRFIDEEDGSDISQIIEIPGSQDYAEQEISLQRVTGTKTVIFLFMPGSKFDMAYFQFG